MSSASACEKRSTTSNISKPLEIWWGNRGESPELSKEVYPSYDWIIMSKDYYKRITEK